MAIRRLLVKGVVSNPSRRSPHQSSTESPDIAIERSLELCNEGVGFLCTGQDQKAISVLSESLSAMKSQLRNRTRLPTSPLVQGCEPSRPVMPSPIPMNSLRSSNFSLYNHGMLVSTMHQRNSKHVPIFSASIVINFALMYHRLAVCRRNTPYYLDKAENMYVLALRLLAASRSIQREDPETVLSMRIAVINNLAHVHHEQAHHDKVTAAIRTLSALLKEVPCEGNRFFQPPILRKLSMNVTLWGPAELLAPAA